MERLLMVVAVVVVVGMLVYFLMNFQGNQQPQTIEIKPPAVEMPTAPTPSPGK